MGLIDWVRKEFEREHICTSCRGAIFCATRATPCCRETLCDDCGRGGRWIVRRDGKRVCRFCEHEYD